MKKTIKKNLISFIITGIFLFATSVCAINVFQASNILVDTSKMTNVGSNKTVQDTIEYLYSKKSRHCPNGYRCIESHTTPQVGDYVRMTPTKTSFTTATSKTGYSSTQTINPSELNMWRVIRINGDGTIDMVSVNVSSTNVYFKGKTGYKNFVGYLNVLASQYANSNYTVRTRHMGYNGQTEYLTDTANTVDSTSTTAPWASSTSNNNNESRGGGDILYQTDYDLVNNVIGTLLATSPNSISYSSYWLASRYYVYYSTTSWHYNGRYIGNSGSLSYNSLYGYSSSSGFVSNSSSYSALRPIVTLKSDISYTPAAGTSYDPFVLE